MKIWIADTNTPAYRQVKFHNEQHSGYEYLGDLDDEELKSFLLNLQDSMDIEKNMKLLKYYGYLHLFIINKS